MLLCFNSYFFVKFFTFFFEFYLKWKCSKKSIRHNKIGLDYKWWYGRWLCLMCKYARASDIKHENQLNSAFHEYLKIFVRCRLLTIFFSSKIIIISVLFSFSFYYLIFEFIIRMNKWTEWVHLFYSIWIQLKKKRGQNAFNSITNFYVWPNVIFQINGMNDGGFQLNMIFRFVTVDSQTVFIFQCILNGSKPMNLWHFIVQYFVCRIQYVAGSNRKLFKRKWYKEIHYRLNGMASLLWTVAFTVKFLFLSCIWFIGAFYLFFSGF